MQAEGLGQVASTPAQLHHRLALLQSQVGGEDRAQGLVRGGG